MVFKVIDGILRYELTVQHREALKYKTDLHYFLNVVRFSYGMSNKVKIIERMPCKYNIQDKAYYIIKFVYIIQTVSMRRSKDLLPTLKTIFAV